jgi:protocatechuate 3,4-dioxygenase alpha subunit
MPRADVITPSQTIGPFFSPFLFEGEDVVASDHPGAVRIHGRVIDGAGEPVPDAMVETWQADPEGRFDHPDDPRGASGSTFGGFGRCHTDGEGRYHVTTVKPGPVPYEQGTQAPHIDVTVFARGLLNRVVTRLYFSDEAEANAADPVLGSIEEARRGTLVAVADGEGFRFDIKLQGDGETVFFSI